MLKQTVIAIQNHKCLKTIRIRSEWYKCYFIGIYMYLHGECLRIWSIGFIWNLWLPHRKNPFYYAQMEKVLFQAVFLFHGFFFYFFLQVLFNFLLLGFFQLDLMIERYACIEKKASISFHRLRFFPQTYKFAGR